MYTWVLSTGWWKNRAPVNPDAVVVVGFLCASLIGGFMYINRCCFCDIKYSLLPSFILGSSVTFFHRINVISTLMLLKFSILQIEALEVH